MVSYKKLYEEQLKRNEIRWEKIPYRCPECDNQLLLCDKGIEIICSNEKCMFDKVFMDNLEYILRGYGSIYDETLKEEITWGPSLKPIKLLNKMMKELEGNK